MTTKRKKTQRLFDNEFLSGEIKGFKKGDRKTSIVFLKVPGTKDLQEVKYRNRDKLTKVFERMQKIEMPLTVMKRRPEKRRGVFYFGARQLTVESYSEDSEGIRVDFVEHSAGRHLVAADNPWLDEIRTKIVHSESSDQQYWFVNMIENDQNEVINILTEVEEPGCNPNLPYIHEFEEVAHAPISVADAQGYFDDLKALSTEPLTNPLTGIPFMYISHGCEHRSHEMCRYLLNWQVHPLKIWAFARRSGLLRTKTKYHPRCKVRWSYHTAPMVLTDRGYRVLDPSVFPDGVVSVDTWFRKIRTFGAKLYSTSHHVHTIDRSLCRFESDPQYEKTELHLEINRICLRLLSQRIGAPPYSQCN